MQFLRDSLVKLITETSTNLPPDVRQAMAWALKTEKPKTQSSLATGDCRSHPARQTAPELRGPHNRKEQRRQSGTRRAHHPF